VSAGSDDSEVGSGDGTCVRVTGGRVSVSALLVIFQIYHELYV
jgi:hypothetical protein